MTTSAPAQPGRTYRPMTAWRLERLRMTRSPRAISLMAVYLFFGLLGPLTAKFLQDIVNRAQPGIQIIVAHPTPRDGIANFIGQADDDGTFGEPDGTFARRLWSTGPYAEAPGAIVLVHSGWVALDWARHAAGSAAAAA